jgi:hypothetical protein
LKGQGFCHLNFKLFPAITVGEASIDTAVSQREVQINPMLRDAQKVQLATLVAPIGVQNAGR